MRLRLLLHLLITVPFLATAQSRRPLQAPVPTWVTSLPVSYTDKQLDDDAEDGYSDLNYENQFSLQENAAYYKKTFRILNEAGVQNCSEVSVDFDPSYEQLIFHSIRIIREGTSLNKLQLSKFSVLQQEKDRDRFIYDGSLTALLVLDDVRKGDIIEYSYTIKGSNPIFKNRFCTDLRLQFNVPIYQLYYKLIVPTGRNITIQNLNSNEKATRSQVNNATVYEWKLNNTSPLRVNEQAPAWYDDFPYVMISEFSSWKEVVDWGKELFPTVTRLSEPLQKKINEINSSGTAEEKIGKTLRFVQDDIRYLGIEMGVNSHKPHSPNEVFAQRFGDCKDKSYLLCTMLRAMNIEAWPVMINTTSKHYITNWLPSPYAFDHVTTLVKANGKEYFFDPTIAYQRGHIGSISFPNYELGLVISDFSRGLLKINNRSYGKTSVFEDFDVTNKNGIAKLKVKTVYTGTFADEVRYDFHTNSRYEISKRYEEFYKPYFDDIEADSVYTKDNEDGSFTTFETYTISNFWDVTNGKKNVTLQPYLISAAIRRPKDKKANYPFELKFPANYYEEIRVKLPEDLDVSESEEKVETGAFRFSSKFRATEDKAALLVYHYQTFRESVAAEDLEDYDEAVNKMDEAIVFDISYKKNNTFSSSGGNTSTNSKFNYTYLYFLLFVCVAITYMVRKNRKRA